MYFKLTNNLAVYSRSLQPSILKDYQYISDYVPACKFSKLLIIFLFQTIVLFIASKVLRQSHSLYGLSFNLMIEVHVLCW